MINTDNILIFDKFNYVSPTKQTGYTIYFGNWGTYYANMNKEQLLYFYRTLLDNSAYRDFGDLYLYFDGELIRQVNWENHKKFTVIKYNNGTK